jgi:hypothetical protein
MPLESEYPFPAPDPSLFGPGMPPLRITVPAWPRPFAPAEDDEEGTGGGDGVDDWVVPG